VDIFPNLLSDGWTIGLGGTNGGDADGPLAVWVPEGNASYQIEPAQKYYVAFGDYQQNSLIKVSSVSRGYATADFGDGSRNEVSIVHDERGMQ
jgi:hypothetical protein